jgi:hypothetical protein
MKVGEVPSTQAAAVITELHKDRSVQRLKNGHGNKKIEEAKAGGTK